MEIYQISFYTAVKMMYFWFPCSWISKMRRGHFRTTGYEESAAARARVDRERAGHRSAAATMPFAATLQTTRARDRTAELLPRVSQNRGYQHPSPFTVGKGLEYTECDSRDTLELKDVNNLYQTLYTEINSQWITASIYKS